ncbi:MAG TPA: tannase/feruloyl esterase family alpha/beta hydrolase [Vicinamibacterales bacterium]
MLRFVVFKDPNWNYRTLDVSKHLDLARKADGGILAAASTDVKPFVNRGGKLIIYHGWEDQNIPPRSSVNYYVKLLNTVGKQQADSAVRLYMVPGMGHCGGGDGPNVFDMVTALEQWREHGRAPADILSSKVQDGRVTRTRPLCQYPQIARYQGSGSIDKAESFACATQ